MPSRYPGSRLPWLRAIVHKVIPVHTYTPLRFELQLAATRLRSGSVAQRYRGASDLLVNVGAGSSGRPGWINVDAFPAANVDCVYDCRKELPFPDGSVRGLFSEHFFEHLDYREEAPHFLAACVRVLQPGGVLRLVVPDIELYLRAYTEGGWDRLSQIRQLDASHREPGIDTPYNTRLEVVNEVMRQGAEHKYGYDFETLDHGLRRAGFSQVIRQSFQRSALPELAIDRPERVSESLYVDAIK
jgi:predicted SAM-dependent methyltransferase